MWGVGGVGRTLRQRISVETSKEGKIRFHPLAVRQTLPNLPLTLLPNKAFLSVS